MNLVSELDLPVFDYTAPDFSADRYHKLPVIWSGPSGGSSNQGLAPDVS
jgi:hypothetical protein